MPSLQIVGANIDTWIINVKGKLDEKLANQLEELKRASQEADEDITTPWIFAGERLFIKAHGSGRQWRWILHCPSLHLDVGRGKLNHLIGKARLASAFLWEHELGDALHLLYDFLMGFYGADFTLQVSEAHLCVDVAGWELSLADAPAFITRGHQRKTHTEDEDPDDDYIAPAFEMNMHGRRCTGYEFSKGAVHSCTIYDKTKEITVSRKDWMQTVWTANGWDGRARVTRVEFRYKRECLKEMGIEEPYSMLDQVPGMWAYSTMLWLRHTIPTADTNRGRWESSTVWLMVQNAEFFGAGIPAVREKKRVGDLRRICQMLSGCSTTAAALLAQALPESDDGTHFLIWFMNWQERYLDEKGTGFQVIRDFKRLQLGTAA